MPKRSAPSVPPPQPSPAVRVVNGLAYRVTQRPEGIASEVTAALQKIAKKARSRQPEVWAVFPVFGRDIVVLGFLSVRTPRRLEQPWAIEPGGTLALHHEVTAYACWEGTSMVGTRHERVDADCVEEFARALEAEPAWQRLGATALDASTLPGGAGLEDPLAPQFFLLTDDGRGADVVLGMSFWRAGEAYAAGRVNTWTRALAEGETVRVVGVRAARVDRDAPLVVTPPRRGPEADAWSDGARAETRAVLDSTRPFAWYFIADAAG